MERDVVCGMQVDPEKAAGTTQYQGRTYYFCSVNCKETFDANPQAYAERRAGAQQKSRETSSPRS